MHKFVLKKQNKTGFTGKISVSQLPSTASPFEIFFRYIVMSAGPSGTEADMLTRARDPVDRSSKRGEIIMGKAVISVGRLLKY